MTFGPVFSGPHAVARLGSRLAAILLALVPAIQARGATLDIVKARGNLVCGVTEGQPGFSEADERGVWRGLNVEFCGALAAAVLGKREAVQYRALMPADRFRAVTSGEVDILANGPPWTLSRDTELGVRFVDVLFYNGLGFLVPRDHAVSSVLELSGASVCQLAGSQAEQGIAEYFRTRKMRYQLVSSEHWDNLVRAYVAGGCTVLAGDVSLLALERSRMPKPADHMLLPELITKEPMGPAIRQGDEEWFAVVRYTVMALIAAEELGVTSLNADLMRDSQLSEVRRLLGQDGNLGQPLGLPRDWAWHVIKQVGNYGEIFDRTLGAKSAFKLDRGLNNLWNRGGLLYAVPLR